MRAVNLIPAERRRGGAGSAGRSGGGAYVVLGTLAGLVLMAVLWAVAHQQAADRRTQAAQASAQASSAEARSSALAGYRHSRRRGQKRRQCFGHGDGCGQSAGGFRQLQIERAQKVVPFHRGR